jgi:signal transduction histidine kinase
MSLMALYMSAHTLVPLRGMRAKVQHLRSGHYDERIPLEGPRELQDLAADLNQAFASLSQREAQLLHGERLAMVDLLLSGVAHEVNTPLTSLLLDHAALSRELTGDLLEPARRARIERLTQRTGVGLQRLEHVVKVLREMAPRLHGPRSEHDINLLVEGALMLLDSPAYRDIEVRKQLTATSRVEAPVTELSHALLAILHNAAQAMAGRGQITIVTQDDGSDVTVSVHDTGPGFAPAVHSRLFQPFLTTKIGASGLGLHLANKAVRELGGTLTVENALPGARVVVRVPRVATLSRND